MICHTIRLENWQNRVKSRFEHYNITIERGLLIAHRQTDSNRRYYTDEHVKQLELILKY